MRTCYLGTLLMILSSCSQETGDKNKGGTGGDEIVVEEYQWIDRGFAYLSEKRTEKRPSQEVTVQTFAYDEKNTYIQTTTNYPNGKIEPGYRWVYSYRDNPPESVTTFDRNGTKESVKKYKFEYHADGKTPARRIYEKEDGTLLSVHEYDDLGRMTSQKHTYENGKSNETTYDWTNNFVRTNSFEGDKLIRTESWNYMELTMGDIGRFDLPGGEPFGIAQTRAAKGEGTGSEEEFFKADCSRLTQDRIRCTSTFADQEKIELCTLEQIVARWSQNGVRKVEVLTASSQCESKDKLGELLETRTIEASYDSRLLMLKREMKSEDFKPTPRNMHIVSEFALNPDHAVTDSKQTVQNGELVEIETYKYRFQ